jgi:hypothetical protein
MQRDDLSAARGCINGLLIALAFWICLFAEAALASACLLSHGAAAACAGAGAAAVAVGYCACRTALKSRLPRAWDRPGGSATP